MYSGELAAAGARQRSDIRDLQKSTTISTYEQWSPHMRLLSALLIVGGATDGGKLQLKESFRRALVSPGARLFAVGRG
jgi:hypothetical protein